MRRISIRVALCLLALAAPVAQAGNGTSGAVFTQEIAALSQRDLISLRSIPNEVTFGNVNAEADFFFNSPGDLNAIRGVRFNRDLGGVTPQVDGQPMNLYFGQLGNFANQDLFQAGFLSQTPGGLSWGGSVLYATEGNEGSTDSNGASLSGFDTDSESLQARFTLGKQVGDWYLGGALTYGDQQDEDEDTFASGATFDNDYFSIESTYTQLDFGAKWSPTTDWSWLIQGTYADNSQEESDENRFDFGTGLNVDRERLDLSRVDLGVSTRFDWYLRDNLQLEAGLRIDRREVDLDDPVLALSMTPTATDTLEATNDDTTVDSLGVWFRSLLRPHERVDVYSTLSWAKYETDAYLLGEQFLGGTSAGTFESLDWGESKVLDLSFGSRLFVTDRLALTVGANWNRFETDTKDMNTTDTGTPFTTVVRGGSESSGTGYNLGLSYVLSSNFRVDAGWFDASGGDKPSSAFQRNFVDDQAVALSVTWGMNRGF